METLKARDARDVEQAVQAALATEQPLEIIGHGTKRGIGRPMVTNAVLDLSALSAVVGYEPSELILTVQAGAPLADVQSLIDAKGQEFAFEPMDTATLLGTTPGAGTIGGMVAAGLAGPRRIRAGGARDHLLGAAAVSGFGEAFKAGGKVVKNVTGYDLCKLIAGSWGTLAVVTEVTFKVMPKAESETTLMLRGLDETTANRAMTAALGSPYDVSAAAHLPAAALQDSGAALGALAAGAQGLTLLRLEGIAASVAHRTGSLSDALGAFGKVDTVSEEASRPLWAAIRDVAPFAAAGARGAWPVWRIVCPPAAGGTLGRALAEETGGEVLYDWGGGLIWLAVPPAPDAFAARVRARTDGTGGHATLIRAGEAVRGAIDVFPPQEAGLAALGRRVKQSFDPKLIFNRHRMVRDAG
ncbi:FAD-binding protein [Bradyrhizobium sp. 2TAF24]|uniref:FAD-binding protein n=1 Tax=Bradyrhizobium sp. 2TAF24 TaxID=3233011 RepID=UPI003F911A03